MRRAYRLSSEKMHKAFMTYVVINLTHKFSISQNILCILLAVHLP